MEKKSVSGIMLTLLLVNVMTLAFNIQLPKAYARTMIGDITGPTLDHPDGIVDIKDIALVAKYFGQNAPPAPLNCDIAGPTPSVPDGRVDIRDIALIAINFGGPPRTASTSPNQLRDPFQRKTFWYGGRVWVMHNNDSNGYMVLTNSADGQSWTQPIYIGTLNNVMGELASLFFDGTYVHFAWENFGTYYDLWYRRGTPYSNGSITLTSPSLIFNGTNDGHLTMPYIAVDSNGYPWVGVDWMGSVDPYTQARVYKSSLKNGTWQTEWSHNLTLTEGIAKAGRTVILKLLNGKVGILYQKITDYVYFDLWNGTAWSITQEQASLQVSSHGDFMSAVSILDDVHLSYLTHTESKNVIYRKRTWGSGWKATETVVVPNADVSQGAVMNLDKTNDSLRVFWTNKPVSGHIYYRQRFSNGTWTSTTDWFTSSDTLTNARTCHVAYETKGGENITFVYQIGTSSPYHFCYNYVHLNGTN